MNPPTLNTPRLVLRPWNDDDLASFAALTADPRVMEHFPKVLTREESDVVAARIRGNMERRGFGFWAVEIPGTVAFAGFVGLSMPGFESHFTPCIEVGWRMAHAYWGHGYATEAARAALDFGFTNLACEQILAFTVPQNQKSRRVMERLGMTHAPADDFDHPNFPEGHPIRRHVLYRLSRSHWVPSPTLS